MRLKPRIHLVRGNRKLGKGVHIPIYHFSIPRLIAYLEGGRFVVTCPGATPWCRVNCYASSTLFKLDNVKKAHLENLLASLSSNFVDEMVKIIIQRYRRNNRRPIIIRLHVEGDFYSEDYIRKWAEIAKLTAGIAYYYAYTRSWRIPRLREAIERHLKPLSNFVVYASTDEFTGPPPTGWLEAAIEKSYNPDFVVCANDLDKRIKCSDCLYCVFGKGNVVFKYKPPNRSRTPK